MSEQNNTISLETILTVEEAQALSDKIQDKIEELKQQELAKAKRQVKVGDWLVFNQLKQNNVRFVVSINGRIYLFDEQGQLCNDCGYLSDIQSMIDVGDYSFKDEVDALSSKKVEVGDIIRWPTCTAGGQNKKFYVEPNGGLIDLENGQHFKTYTIEGLQHNLDNGRIEIVQKG